VATTVGRLGQMSAMIPAEQAQHHDRHELHDAEQADIHDCLVPAHEIPQSHPRARLCIQVPDTEISWPMKKRRKLRVTQGFGR